MTTGFVRGSDHINQLMQQSKIAAPVHALEVETRHLDQVFDTGDFSDYVHEHHRESL